MHLHVLLLPGGRLPSRAAGDQDAVGYDLYAPADGFIDPMQRSVIPLGFKTEFTPGYVGKIFDRSGLAAKSGILSLAGVIDPSYRGEWGIILYNTTHKVFRYSAGDRLGQAVFFKVELPEVCLVTLLSETVRGVGGYGSTGK
jgi:dUTP pyrophosphatase